MASTNTLFSFQYGGVGSFDYAQAWKDTGGNDPNIGMICSDATGLIATIKCGDLTSPSEG